MMKNLTNEQKNQTLFITLVQQLQMQAWVSLGKIKNPVTDKMDKNLNLAKLSIDMLDMLKAKSQGNLSEDEKRLIDQTLSNLKLNFVDEKAKADREKTAEPATEQKAEEKSS